MKRIITLYTLVMICTLPSLVIAMNTQDNYTEDEYALFSLAIKCINIVTAAIKENQNFKICNIQKPDGIQVKSGLLLDIKTNTISVCSPPLGTLEVVRPRFSGRNTDINKKMLLQELKEKEIVLNKCRPQELLKDFYPESCKTPMGAEGIANALGMGKVYEIQKYKDIFIAKAELKARNNYMSQEEIDNKITLMLKRYEDENPQPVKVKKIVNEHYYYPQLDAATIQMSIIDP